mmetsp:Transcript_68163/g.134603  ORF Transcript_68163/g.134603 Transcript_68163/m.134603 type:complete len:316 (+) Transcript_68163:1-948(+)
MAPKRAKATAKSPSSSPARSENRQRQTGDGPSALDLVTSLGEAPKKKEIVQLIAILGKATSEGDVDLLQEACNACGCIFGACSHAAFSCFLQHGGVEALLSAAQLEAGQGGDAAVCACGPLCRGAAAWLGQVDEVDFHELPWVLSLAKLLGCVDEEVAMEALGAVERFVLHRREHAVAMLQGGVLQVVHQILGVHRNPELVQEAFVVTFRICDMPKEAVVNHICEERPLVGTVVEALGHAPLNMRLQMAGLRLLALWARMGERKVLASIAEADAHAALKRTLAELERSDLSHAAAWVSAAVGRILSGAVPQRQES